MAALLLPGKMAAVLQHLLLGLCILGASHSSLISISQPSAKNVSIEFPEDASLRDGLILQIEVNNPTEDVVEEGYGVITAEVSHPSIIDGDNIWIVNDSWFNIIRKQKLCFKIPTTQDDPEELVPKMINVTIKSNMTKKVFIKLTLYAIDGHHVSCSEFNRLRAGRQFWANGDLIASEQTGTDSDELIQDNRQTYHIGSGDYNLEYIADYPVSTGIDTAIDDFEYLVSTETTPITVETISQFNSIETIPETLTQLNIIETISKTIPQLREIVENAPKTDILETDVIEIKVAPQNENIKPVGQADIIQTDIIQIEISTQKEYDTGQPIPNTQIVVTETLPTIELEAVETTSSSETFIIETVHGNETDNIGMIQESGTDVKDSGTGTIVIETTPEIILIESTQEIETFAKEVVPEQDILETISESKTGDTETKKEADVIDILPDIEGSIINSLSGLPTGTMDTIPVIDPLYKEDTIETNYDFEDSGNNDFFVTSVKPIQVTNVENTTAQKIEDIALDIVDYEEEIFPQVDQKFDDKIGLDTSIINSHFNRKDLTINLETETETGVRMVPKPQFNIEIKPEFKNLETETLSEIIGLTDTEGSGEQDTSDIDEPLSTISITTSSPSTTTTSTTTVTTTTTTTITTTSTTSITITSTGTTTTITTSTMTTSTTSTTITTTTTTTTSTTHISTTTTTKSTTTSTTTTTNATTTTAYTSTTKVNQVVEKSTIISTSKSTKPTSITETVTIIATVVVGVLVIVVAIYTFAAIVFYPKKRKRKQNSYSYHP